MKLEQTEPQKELQQTIDQEVLLSGFSGTVLVTQHDQTLAAAACGHSNVAEERINQLNTCFGIASGSKLFTAVAICQLVEQGKLSFDGKVLEVLHEQKFPLFSPEITVHQAADA